MRHGRTPLFVAVGLVVAALVFGVVVVTAGGGGGGGDPLDTAGAADTIDAIAGVGGRPRPGGHIESCPAGEWAGLRAELDETDLDQAELVAYAYAGVGEGVGDGIGMVGCELTFDDDGGEGLIALLMSGQADRGVEVLPDLAGDVDFEPLDDARGGQVLGRCIENEYGPRCQVVWIDDEVMVAISGSGRPFADLDVERVADALVTALPELIDRLAG